APKRLAMGCSWSSAVAGNDDEGIIRLFGGLSDDVTDEFLRGSTSIDFFGKVGANAIAGENERITGMNRHGDRDQRRKIMADDAAAQQQTFAGINYRALIGTEQAPFDIADANPGHRPSGLAEHGQTQHHAAHPFQRFMALPNQRDNILIFVG